MSYEDRLRREVHAALQADAAAAEVDDAAARLELEVIIEEAKGYYRPIPNEIIEWAAA